MGIDFSFNVVVGMPLGALSLILLFMGNFVNESYFLYAGYASAIAGILMLLNTIFVPGVYIGKVLAPVMFLSIVLMAVIGLSLIFQPMTLFAQQYIADYYMKIFYVYIVIYAFAILHVTTGW